MSKYDTILAVLILLSLQSNCFSFNINRDAVLKIQTDAVDNFDQSSVRVIRQAVGYHQGQPREQTVIVVPNSGSNLPYRGVPTTYGAPPVVVNVPGSIGLQQANDTLEIGILTIV